MKLNKSIGKEIYEIECSSREEALEFISNAKKEYPYAVLEGTGYNSNIYILHLHLSWGKYLSQELAVDGEPTTCINCGRCKEELRKPSRNSSLGMASSPERCFYEEFWSEVVEQIDKHFLMNDSAYYFTKGEGGFYDRRFNIKLDDGRVLKDIGLWHRGEVPPIIRHLFVKGESMG